MKEFLVLTFHVGILLNWISWRNIKHIPEKWKILILEKGDNPFIYHIKIFITGTRRRYFCNGKACSAKQKDEICVQNCRGYCHYICCLFNKLHYQRGNRQQIYSFHVIYIIYIDCVRKLTFTDYMIQKRRPRTLLCCYYCYLHFKMLL
jgi:hypothetical protein